MRTGQRTAFARGFSLIELMVAVVIVGILAAVAIPSYKQYLIRGNRTAAKAAILDLASREQQHLLTSRSYADTATLTAEGYSPDPAATKYYTWGVTVDSTATPPTFTITFQGKSGTSQASDGGLRLDSRGVQSTLDAGGNVTTAVDHWNQ
jgi:type IV pilus assembly protein PilE